MKMQIVSSESVNNMDNNKFKRHVGIAQLTFAGITGIIGSGWLFTPYIALRISGPYSLISWIVGFSFALILALCYAEVASLTPASGLMVHLAQMTNGPFIGQIWSTLLFLSYSAMPAIELLAFIGYLNQVTGKYLVNDVGTLTLFGFVAASLFMILFLFLGMLGIKTILNINGVASIGKVLVPLTFAITLIVTHFHSENFYNVAHINAFYGITASLSSAGIIFSCLGFRQIIELSGEAREASDVATSILLSTAIAGSIYLVLQLSVIGYFNPSLVLHGFPSLILPYSGSAPLFSISIMSGMLWLTIILTFEALTSPAITSFLALITASRIYYAIALRSFVQKIKLLLYINKRGAPLIALFSVAIISILFMLPFPSWASMVKYLTAASAISYSIGPLTLLQLRKSMPDVNRPFRLPLAFIVAPIGFVMSSLIICFTGLHIQLALIMLVLLITLFLKTFVKKPNLVKSSQRYFWFYFYILGLVITTSVGPTVIGGYGIINMITVSIITTFVSIVSLYWAISSTLSSHHVAEYLSAIKVSK